MVYLYKDFFNSIFQWCDERTKCILGSCCKKAWEALIENRKNCKSGTYNLKPLQNFIREQILYFNIIFQAPMSYGKTATGLCAAFNGWKLNLRREDRINKLCIIIVPSKAIGVWKEEAIKMFGKEILNARTGIEAVEACSKNPDIDIILMDIQMPEMSGYEATRQIREFNKDVIIIAQTAFGQSGDREKAIEAGCNDHISKPIKSAELHDLIKKYFKKKF